MYGTRRPEQARRFNERIGYGVELHSLVGDVAAATRSLSPGTLTMMFYFSGSSSLLFGPFTLSETRPEKP